MQINDVWRASGGLGAGRPNALVAARKGKGSRSLKGSVVGISF